ncbi:UDP-N-acetylglucosamine 2-epimerase [Paenibacillus radicis (ex Gao et al. 2016)]|uniref:UDP-N-acetyl glucosamine 2-epimerase n=1 Tax=Paenibacillus radicis (ex Gao et al. 2016) TaxID=1737354 RepID=A0A917HP21_9BACL|nr:UDP-N-acetylglucosamine 2-epimerase [Paenibacillus radicis (ex Gao et al. 2016)]GGG84527.1 UDP-N-acetyl glucosamine 2-epimerase [Paenibacillus radicis (ex Gao et al. 2016)]
MRKICIISGSRAEYGLLYPLLKAIKEDPELTLQLVVTGMHLSPEFGLTYSEIEADGFQIDERVEMLLSSDSHVGITKSMGLGLIGFADALYRLQPDIVVVLGDRYEIMVAAQAAMIANIPIAHLHGGERTEGAVDEAIRHSITKMSHLHFVATEQYRNRVIQLGEQPDKVFHVGAIGLDNIRELQYLTREQFEESIDFRLGEVNFLVTYHPATLQGQSSEQLMQQLLLALHTFPEAKILFTMPNSDADGRIMSAMIHEYVKSRPGNAAAFQSLGKLRYLSAMQFVDVVIGNSSSGIFEVPMFKKPTVDIGNRQKGRIKGSSIISSSENESDIVKAIEMALNQDFLASNVYPSQNLYGDGNTAIQIKQILKNTSLDGILLKSFYDIQL